MARYATYAITNNDADCPAHIKEPPYYSFFAPVAAYLWNRIGYHSLVFVVGDYDNKLVRNGILNNNSKIVDIHDDSQLLTKYRHSTIAQFARIFGYLYVDDLDYCLTSDVDVLPLSEEYFHHVNPMFKKFDVWSSDHYGDNPYNMERFPMCFMGAFGNVWQEIVDNNSDHPEDVIFQELSGLTRGNEHWESWFYDEKYLMHKLKRWEGFLLNCRMLKRGTVKEGEDIMALSRIDRGVWHEDIVSPIDIHSIRPGHTGENWESLRRIFEREIGVEDTKWIVNFRNDFVDYLNDK